MASSLDEPYAIEADEDGAVLHMPLGEIRGQTLHVSKEGAKLEVSLDGETYEAWVHDRDLRDAILAMSDAPLDAWAAAE